MPVAIENSQLASWLVERKRIFKQEIDETRKTLERQLILELDRIKAGIPPQLLQLSLSDFLQLHKAIPNDKEGMAQEVSLLSMPMEGVSRYRRVTRSMAAKMPNECDLIVTAAQDLSALKRQTIVTENSTATLGATPKFHPGLPETPALIRKRGRSSKAPSGVLAHPPSNSTGRKTTRPRASQSGIFLDPSMHPALHASGRPHGSLKKESSNIFAASSRPSMGTRATVRSSILRIDPDTVPGDSRRSLTAGMMSVELQDGKLLDVDITESPSKAVANLGAEAVREMKAKMQAYAAQLKSFFKRLKVHEK